MYKTLRIFYIPALFLFLGFKLAGQEKEIVSPAFPEIFFQFSSTRDLALSADGDEIYFTVLSPLEEISVIAYSKLDNGKWSTPELAPFSGASRELEPFLSPDGLRLYFASNRPLVNPGEEKDFDIWYVKRESLTGKWSEPINIGVPVNSENDEFFPSVAINNNIYFTADMPDSKGRDDIYFSVYQNNKYLAPISLSDSINSDGYEFNAYIAPDESYLIYSGYNREDGMGSGDLYISYRKQGDSWSKSRNLGPGVNSKQMDYCPFVDLRTNTLYFTSKRSQVSGQQFSSLEEFLEEIKKYENGFSRIYKTSIIRGLGLSH